jgi:hypothetical protein
MVGSAVVCIVVGLVVLGSGVLEPQQAGRTSALRDQAQEA